MDHILKQINTAHTLTLFFRNFHINIILPFTSTFLSDVIIRARLIIYDLMNLIITDLARSVLYEGSHYAIR
jgi:hypothetical protein